MNFIPAAYALGDPSDLLTEVNTAINLKPFFSNPILIVSALLPNFFFFSGLVLFVMILISAIQLAVSAANPDAAEAAKRRLTMAIVGFLLIFSSYWIAQALQIILGIPIVTDTPGSGGGGGGNNFF